MNHLGKLIIAWNVAVLASLVYYWPKIVDNAPRPDEGVLFFIANRSTDSRRIPLGKSNHDIEAFKFDFEAPLFVVIHGYTESSFRDWIEELIPALLNAEPSSTILIVDHWNFLCFSRPIMNSNIHFIAKDVARVLNIWSEASNLRMKNVHLIGFSLGGRIAGVVPHYLKSSAKIGRITGVDPSFPWTKTENTSEFLDSGDADLVVAIRTSTVGLENPPVHVDFYVNNGILQPGCEKWYRFDFIEQICSHYKAPFLFVSAIRETSANLTSCKCQGQSRPPNPKDCSCNFTNSFGLHTDARSQGVFHIAT